MMAKPMKTLELHYPMIQFFNNLSYLDLRCTFYNGLMVESLLTLLLTFCIISVKELEKKIKHHAKQKLIPKI